MLALFSFLSTCKIFPLTVISDCTTSIEFSDGLTENLSTKFGESSKYLTINTELFPVTNTSYCSLPHTSLIIQRAKVILTAVVLPSSDGDLSESRFIASVSSVMLIFSINARFHNT
jgi:hypothetical protein